MEDVWINADTSESSGMVEAGASTIIAGDGIGGINGAVNSNTVNSSGSDDKINDAVAQELWDRCAAAIAKETDLQIYEAFIKPLRLVSFSLEQGEVTLACPSKLVRDRVFDSFRGKIVENLCGMLELSEIKITLTVENRESLNNASSPPKPYVIVKKTRSLAAHRGASMGSGVGLSSQTGAFSDYQKSSYQHPSQCVDHFVNPKYTFANFVVGNNNQFCHAAALRVGESPGQNYNPLFIYGGVGLGKTHLLHAIGNAVLEKNRSARVMYISSETFTNELIQALRLGKMEEFKSRLRGVEVLLIDDIQFLCGKERTQEEFFHTFNALYGAKHQIVITCDKVPQEIPGLEERLQTRFSWGLSADLQAPDFETRVAILKRKAVLDGFDLSDDVANLVAQSISSNVRELEGALNRVHAISSLQGKSISIELANSAIQPLLQPKRVKIAVSEIKRVVAEHFNIKISEMISKRRTKNLSFPRHIGMYLCRKHTTCSYPEIGGHFGGRDHSSVIHAANVVSTKIESDPYVRGLVADIEKRLLT